MTDALAARVRALDWYHTLDLGGGVVTPGWFDLRAMVDKVGWPGSLSGRRGLDVGTFDGFWAFEMERRGATEVLAVDVLDPEEWDWPVGSAPEVIADVGRRKAGGAGFELARAALGSAVQRRELSVYDLDPSDVGTFDFVYVGSLLLHLRDPIGALERVRAVCAGELVVVDAVDAPLSRLLRRRPAASLDGVGRPWWWKPNLAGLGRMVEAAGFSLLDRPRQILLPAGGGQPRPPRRARVLVSRVGREAAMRVWRGDPHGVVRGSPRR